MFPKLKIRDICSKTMQVRFEDAKHNTYRYTILSQQALEILRENLPHYTYIEDSQKGIMVHLGK